MKRLLCALFGHKPGKWRLRCRGGVFWLTECVRCGVGMQE